jgi:hypothetical protein
MTTDILALGLTIIAAKLTGEVDLDGWSRPRLSVCCNSQISFSGESALLGTLHPRDPIPSALRLHNTQISSLPDDNIFRWDVFRFPDSDLGVDIGSVQWCGYPQDNVVGVQLGVERRS